MIQNLVARRLAAGYDPRKPGRYRDRFFQKYNRERTMPIKWRSLEETLNPQPVAFDVIRKLLQYIDRCDEASKTNLPRPRFCAEDGSPIFPPEGEKFELWWLTDVKRKEKGDDEHALEVEHRRHAARRGRATTRARAGVAAFCCRARSGEVRSHTV